MRRDLAMLLLLVDCFSVCFSRERCPAPAPMPQSDNGDAFCGIGVLGLRASVGPDDRFSVQSDFRRVSGPAISGRAREKQFARLGDAGRASPSLRLRHPSVD